MMALAPSLDRSRREFPFVVAACLSGDAKPGALAAAAADWLEDIGEVAIGAVTGVHDLGRLDAILRDRESRLDVPDAEPQAVMKPGFVRLSGPEVRSPGAMLPHLLDYCSGASGLWWTRGSALVEPTVLKCQALPAERRFAALIDGRWTAHGW
jgi:type VI secretion system protein ImpM